MARRHLLIAITALLWVSAGARAQTPPALKPLMRSFAAYARDVDRLDQLWVEPDRAQQPTPLPQLPAP
ncbi:MAG: hypothetical protein ACO24U_09685, partial [Prochlorococcaceae cyanobacterium]